MLAARLFIKLSAQLRDGGVSKASNPAPLNGDTQTLRQIYINASDARGNGTAYKSEGKTATGIPKQRNGHHILGAEDPGAEAPSTAMMSLQLSSDAIRQKVDHGELIPRLEEEFWNVYGNMLRVFGTEEKVCIIGPANGKA